MTVKKGYVCLVLHAHLPYVRHPEYEFFFEENWLFEAMTDCYIPLLQVLDRLHEDQVHYRLTLSISPTLIFMLRDTLLQKRYQVYLDKRIALAEQEIVRTKHEPQLQKLARLYRRSFLAVRNTYRQYHYDLLSGFKKQADLGYLELITTTATHGFLPLLNNNKTAVFSQIKIGLDTFSAHFGENPVGFWLPECGYYPGLEKVLADQGIRYFFADHTAVTEASERSVNGVYAPLDCGNGVLAFARNPHVSQRVWSAETGYPGASVYREYYSDIGFDLDLETVTPYLFDGKTRSNTGIKYHRITGSGFAKELYDLTLAKQQIRQDADNFVLSCQQQIAVQSERMDSVPLIVAPYDAELFGHWWYEGCSWLESVLRLMHDTENGLVTLTGSDYRCLQTVHQVATPAFSSWGAEGNCSYWLNEKNDWIYPFLYKMMTEMEKLAVDFARVSVTPLQERALNQALRCVLLAQASDWAFIIKSGTTVEYARKRIMDYIARFNYLHDCLRKNRLDEHYLQALEIMDNIFPAIHFLDFLPVET